MRRFNKVSTISDNMLERLLTKGVAQEKSVLLPNWVDAQDIFPLSKASIYRAELGIEDDKCVALYSGNMGEKQGLEILLAAARSLQAESRLLFVLCGAGAARERLMQIGTGLHNVRWLPLQPVKKLNELLNLADVHLLPQRADTADLVMPSKLLGMLASGRPVLATAHPGTQLAKMVSSCGKVVEPGNAQEVAQGLLELLHAPQERKRLGMEARKAAQAWDKSSVLHGFENQLLVMCKQ
jgi:colanic acid biosynthesis glycosyl transferase WcaI